MKELDELQKALEQMLHERIAWLRDKADGGTPPYADLRIEELENIKKVLPEKLSVFRQSLTVPVNIEKQAKTTGQLASEMGRKYQNADKCEAFEFQNKKWVSLDVVQQYLIAKERSLIKLLASRPNYMSDGELYRVGHSIDWMNYGLQCKEWFEKAEKVFAEDFAVDATFAPTNEKGIIQIDRKQLEEIGEFLVLGQPAIFPYVQTEYDKGYSKGYYAAKDQVQSRIRELLSGYVDSGAHEK